MAVEEPVERAIQALLDGVPLTGPVHVSGGGAPGGDAFAVVDAIARAHRTAMFGSDVPPDREPASRWGHLEIRSEIGRGASGSVYRAWDPKLAREVALKLLAPETLESIDALAEGRLLARLNHPHIVRVFGAGEHDGASGIWMELLEGETLDDILERDGVFGPEETLLIGCDLARALSAVHAAGLLHRDVKARNVVREQGGRIVLMDLGAGRPAGERQGAFGEPGTPLYMAPEVLGGGAATVRSDIYALGVLLYRLLTGAYPVIASSRDELRSAHAARRRSSLAALRPDVSIAVLSAVERACEFEPAARYASAAELEGALADALRRSISATPVVPAMTRRWKRWRSRITLIVACAAVVLASIAGGWNTAAGRAARRRAGLTVPPRSRLYLALNGGLGILDGRRLAVMPFNPTTAGTIAASSDLGVRTMSALPPWTAGGAFALDGRPIVAPSVVNAGACCWGDGTTDGAFNYAIRQDSTLLDPIGSRPLAPPAVYRFNRDWSKPELDFALERDATYAGIAYSGRSQSFWLTRYGNDQSWIEEWSSDGRHIATPVTVSAAMFKGIASDPLDGTLWVVREQAGSFRLENFDRTGRWLSTLEVDTHGAPLGAGGIEFAWVSR